MKGDHLVLRAAAALCAPLIVLFALSLLAQRTAGSGIGFSAGLAMAAPVLLHVLVYGVAAARAALPPVLVRGVLAIGLLLTLAGASAPRLGYAPQLMEAGLFLVASATSALLLVVLIGRAPTLRDEDW